jgi:hypothetical protein
MQIAGGNQANSTAFDAFSTDPLASRINASNAPEVYLLAC